MLYKGKAVELVGEKEVFGKHIAWIRILEDNSFIQVVREELETEARSISLAYLRFVSIAAKIKDEIAQKKILAPYESSLLPLPHQILVLEKVMQSKQNRFLLADEVGMGKTIETGLILKELKLTGEIKRILAIVPKSSMLQWQSEMKEHFNEMFHIYDSVMINHMTRIFSNINADEEYNFWMQHNQVIVSTDALKPLEKRQGWTKERIDEYNKYRLEAVLEADYDLIIIDEAHKMGGSTALVSRYVLAQQLCNIVPNVLLLTATPHRGKSDHFRRILQLLEPDAFAGEGLPEIKELESYVIRTQKRLAVDYEGNKLFMERITHRFDVSLEPMKHYKQIDLYESVTGYVRRGFNTARQQKNTARGLIMVLFQRLVSSSTAAILSAMQGRLERLLNGEEDSLDNFADEMDVISDETEEGIDFDKLYQPISNGLVNEMEILKELIHKAQDCLETETDAKAEALMLRFSGMQQEEGDHNLKIIVFTEFRATQRMLKAFFEKKGYKCVVINGDQEMDERKRSLTLFKNEAQILVATDAAGESLNMQFCHIVFNYDLPWNPMMIEQRIGRVDRIGQKKKVAAFNMLTNNSVDQRVYEVIVEKLNNILDQLGIDKTSDVLDSTIEMKDINHLYLRSLLDPEHFHFAEESWLHEIREKLRNFKATEGILPEVQESDIDPKKAAEIKHSPLPQWLEDLLRNYMKIKGGTIHKNLLGIFEMNLDGQNSNLTFDSEIALANPVVEHLTLQHNLITRILSELGEFITINGVPVIQSKTTDETPGYFSIWQIIALNAFETRTSYQSYFIADNGKFYDAYANDIWTRLVTGGSDFSLVEGELHTTGKDFQELLNQKLFVAFENLEADVKERIKIKYDNRMNAYNFQKHRIKKIGIENIRNAKLKRLEKEHNDWLKSFQLNQSIIPDIRQLLTVRLNG